MPTSILQTCLPIVCPVCPRDVRCCNRPGSLSLSKAAQAGASSSQTVTACRREEQQEAKQAAAFEAAGQARAAVKAWKKPRLSPSQASLPVELWGLVLNHLLTEDSLWDLPATVQELCHASLACKGLYAAVQQQGWARLCQLLDPLPTPPTACRLQLLPFNPDLLVNDPASLHVPQLRAACSHFHLPSSGQLPLPSGCKWPAVCFPLWLR